jgi:PAS domain S-box-containing protein
MNFESFLEMQRYVGWSPRDAEVLARFSPQVTPHLGAIADEFYECVRAFPDAVRVLRDEAQVQRLQKTLQRWLQELLDGPHDRAYFERRRSIGEVHARIGVPQRFVFTAMSILRQHLERILQESYPTGSEAQERTRKALDRALDVELALMLETYRESWMERLQRFDRVEREGISQRLAAAQERYRGAIETAQALILVLDDRENILLWNRMAAQVTGYDRDELLDRLPLETLIPDEEARQKIRGVTPETPVTFEAALRIRSGREHHVRWLVSANHDHELDGLIRYVIGVDLTDAHEAAQRARNTERLAAIGTMAAGLAHEIRNPLNAASLHVTLLERSLKRLAEPPATAMDAAGVLRSEIQRLSSLVNEFLDFARPKPLRLGEHMLCELCASVVELLRPDAEAAGVELQFSPPRRPIWIKVDGERFRQVLINLLRNAIEATSGAAEPRVTLKVRRSASWAELDIEDNGKGIADGTPIFDAFYTSKETGTGLGLSIVHRIIDDHGGSITYRSAPGETVFTVRLPGAYFINDD